jgi:hypothetical protein
MDSELADLLARGDVTTTPFSEALTGFLGMQDYLEVQRQEAVNNPDGDRPATVADVFSVMDNVHMFRLRLGGMLLRALPARSPVRAEAEDVFTGWCAEAAAGSRSEVIPIKDLVAVQAGAILATVQESLRLPSSGSGGEPPGQTRPVLSTSPGPS